MKCILTFFLILFIPIVSYAVRVDWQLMTGQSPVTVTTAWHPVKGVSYIIAVGMDKKTLWLLKVSVDGTRQSDWEIIQGEGETVELIWVEGIKKMMLLVTNKQGQIWRGILE